MPLISATAKATSLRWSADGPAPALHLEHGAKALILADTRRAATIGAHAPGATILTDVAQLEGMEGTFDGALIDGLLEHHTWDRWVLQRVHRLLRIGAPIVVVVPAMLSFASLTDMRFWSYAFRRVLGRLLQWGVKSQWVGARSVHRRYHLPSLVYKMESLGFAAIEAEPIWSANLRAPWLAGQARIVARKAPSMSGTKGRRWPEIQAVRRRQTERTARLRVAREAWLAAFPQFRALHAEPIDPAAWSGERVLVLAPHPDDELIGCGGTLSRLLPAGADVSIVHATDGSKLISLRHLPEKRRKAMRLEEAARVATALGARLHLWKMEDGALTFSRSTVARLTGLLADLRPDRVFTPFLGDMHADHWALSCILGAALAKAGIQPEILQYEVWSLVPANRYCVITDQAEKLERLLLLYERAMQVDDFVHFCEHRNFLRALELTGRPAYVEAFLATDSTEYQRLAASRLSESQ